MIRRLGALVTAGLVLGACGSQSASSAMRQWSHQSDFAGAVARLRLDAVHAVEALRDPASGPNLLHTVCAVTYVDSLSANSSLPTPDAQATTLLGRAYGQLGSAATTCSDAGASAPRRARAIAQFERAVATLAEARARVEAAS
ncbi:MAG: hypothetical protein KGJ36_00870 [Acidobacteriota bacterium]|nr:hypothetical protein [Acidobacteriota bacterium]